VTHGFSSLVVAALGRITGPFFCLAKLPYFCTHLAFTLFAYACCSEGVLDPDGISNCSEMPWMCSAFKLLFYIML